jgi:hypothetical protein
MNQLRDLRVYEQAVNANGVRLKIAPIGKPPYREYELTYHCRGYVNERGATSDTHVVLLRLPSNFPAGEPIFHVKSKHFHPNVWEYGLVCLPGWSQTSSLVGEVVRVSRVLRHEPDSYNLGSMAFGSQGLWQGFGQAHQRPSDAHPFPPPDIAHTRTPAVGPAASGEPNQAPSKIRLPGRSPQSDARSPDVLKIRMPKRPS